MKKLEFVLLMALSAAMLCVTAAAQNVGQVKDRGNVRVDDATYYPNQGAGLVRLVDWDDRHRCDGDHDRDDRNCYWRGRDRYRNQYYASGNGYYGNAPVYGQGGWYDQYHRWHAQPGGWYDRKGRWHNDKHHEHDDR
ncbi:MAG TPA: hypothetical protein VIH91_12540 [Terriglobales bacterium]